MSTQPATSELEFLLKTNAELREENRRLRRLLRQIRKLAEQEALS